MDFSTLMATALQKQQTQNSFIFVIAQAPLQWRHKVLLQYSQNNHLFPTRWKPGMDSTGSSCSVQFTWAQCRGLIRNLKVDSKEGPEMKKSLQIFVLSQTEKEFFSLPSSLRGQAPMHT